MIEAFMEKLRLEWGFAEPFEPSAKGVYNLAYEGDVAITLTDTSPGVRFFSAIGPIPLVNTDRFYAHCLTGNLFGQATQGAVLGSDSDGKVLTLSLHIDYNAEYPEFRDKLDDFKSAVELWKDELQALSVEIPKKR